MKWATLIIVSLAIVVASQPVVSTGGQPEDLYGQIIDHKIAQCDRKALLTATRGPNLQAYGRKALDQAAFYRNQRASLVRQMVSLGVEPKDYKVHYFLIRGYRDPKSSKLATRLSEIE